jgi:hypothetical protein
MNGSKSDPRGKEEMLVILLELVSVEILFNASVISTVNHS